MTAPILVFGASGGIGTAVARRLAREGHGLFLTARNEDRLRALGQELDAPVRAGDVTRGEDLAAIVDQAGGDGLAGLVFAVGSIDLLPIDRAGPESFAQSYSLNVIAAAQAVRHARAALQRAGGAVVLYSSVAAGLGFKNHSVIAAAKAGVEGLARALAAELAPAVRINCIAPTLTRTPLAASMTASAPLVQALGRQHALGRIGEPGDIAAATALLLGEAGAFMTGQVLHVDGGRAAVVA
ncbi:SDR family oxidoreductase [Geminicoccaceae bacterium 1502E]|nr:SDR family oxidoreductase [Geminicoccaceae bacterium 1502E]